MIINLIFYDYFIHTNLLYLLLFTFNYFFYCIVIPIRYRSINTESNAFKSKLAPLVGPVLMLKALGFVKNEEEGKFVLDG